MAAAPATDWRTAAACRGQDPSLFFAPDLERETDRQARESAAAALCARCPVRDACREFALAQPRPYGWWGGLSEDGLKAERRRRLRALRRAA